MTKVKTVNDFLHEGYRLVKGKPTSDGYWQLVKEEQRGRYWTNVFDPDFSV